MQPNLTNEQRLYAAFMEYSIMAGSAASYCESPNADRKIVEKIKAIDNVIYNKLESVRVDMNHGKDINNTIYVIEQLLITMKEWTP